MEVAVIRRELHSEAEVRTQGDVAVGRGLALGPLGSGEGWLRLFDLKGQVGAVVSALVLFGARALVRVEVPLGLGLPS